DVLTGRVTEIRRVASNVCIPIPGAWICSIRSARAGRIRRRKTSGRVQVIPLIRIVYSCAVAQLGSELFPSVGRRRTLLSGRKICHLLAAGIGSYGAQAIRYDGDVVRPYQFAGPVEIAARQRG